MPVAVGCACCAAKCALCQTGNKPPKTLKLFYPQAHTHATQACCNFGNENFLLERTTDNSCWWIYNRACGSGSYLRVTMEIYLFTGNSINYRLFISVGGFPAAAGNPEPTGPGSFTWKGTFTRGSATSPNPGPCRDQIAAGVVFDSFAGMQGLFLCSPAMTGAIDPVLSLP